MRDKLPLADFQDFAAAIEAADGVAAFNDDSLLGYNRKRVLWCAGASGECLAAAVWQQEGDTVTAELAVASQARRRGVARHLVSAIARDADPTTTALLVWAHGNLPAQQRFAAALGFTAVRELHKMVLPDIAAALADMRGAADSGAAAAAQEVVTPDVASSADGASATTAAGSGVTVRSFTPADSEAWVQLNREVFANHPEQGKLTLRDLQERLAQRWADPHNFLLLQDASGKLLGYNWLKITPEAAEIYVLGVAPAQAGHGYGKLLLQAGLQRLLELGHSRVELYVDAANTAALRLYQRCGFEIVETHTQYRLGAAVLQSLAGVQQQVAAG